MAPSYLSCSNSLAAWRYWSCALLSDAAVTPTGITTSDPTIRPIGAWSAIRTATEKQNCTDRVRMLRIMLPLERSCDGLYRGRMPKSILGRRSACSAGAYPPHFLEDLLFGQQSAFDVGLDHAGFVNKHADRQAIDPVLIRHPVLAVHQDGKRVVVGANVFVHLRLIFQFIDRQHDKPLVAQFVKIGRAHV